MTASAATTRTCVRGTSRPATAPPVLKLAQGVELLGEFKGSGYREAPHLVRRADGQMLQLSRLTYLLLDALAGGATSPEAAATAVCRRTDRPISAAGVQFLVDNKLAPLGLVANGAISIQVPTANPFLALRARATLLTPRVNKATAVVVRSLFLRVVRASIIAAVA